MGSSQSNDAGSSDSEDELLSDEGNDDKSENLSDDSNEEVEEDPDEEEEEEDEEEAEEEMNDEESEDDSEEDSEVESAVESEEGKLEQEPELSPFKKHLSPLDPQLPVNFSFEDHLTLPAALHFSSLYESSSLRPFNQLNPSDEQQSPTFQDYDPNPTASTEVESLTHPRVIKFDSVNEDFKSMHPIHESFVPNDDNSLYSKENTNKFSNQTIKKDQELITEVYLIRHGEATHNILNIVGGRSPSATLTPLGLKQATALGKYLKHFTDIRFDAVYSSTIERSKETAIAVCKELSISEQSICYSDELQELSQGEWEGRSRTEVYTDQILHIINQNQPDFRAPGGESQRQVEYRMLEFVNNNILHWNSLKTSKKTLTKMENGQKKFSKFASDPLNRDFSESSLKSFSEIDSDTENDLSKSTIWDIFNASDKSGELQKIFSKDNMDLKISDEARPKSTPTTNSSTRVAVFTHGLAIKCLLRGILNSSPNLTNKISIDNTSITVIKHSSVHGWHVLKINDTSHFLLSKIHY